MSSELSQSQILFLSSVGLIAYAERLEEKGIESVTPAQIKAQANAELALAQKLSKKNENLD